MVMALALDRGRHQGRGRGVHAARARRGGGGGATTRGRRGGGGPAGGGRTRRLAAASAARGGDGQRDPRGPDYDGPGSSPGSHVFSSWWVIHYPLKQPSWGTVLESLHRQMAVEHRQSCKNRITGEPRVVGAAASNGPIGPRGARYGPSSDCSQTGPANLPSTPQRVHGPAFPVPSTSRPRRQLGVSHVRAAHPDPVLRERPCRRRYTGLRPAPRRQDGGARDRPAPGPRRPLAGLHTGCRRGLHRHRRASGARDGLHLEGQHRRGGHRRHRRPGPGRHRPAGRAPGDGGQGGPVQAVRRRRRGPDLPGLHGRGRVGGDRGAARARLRRHQPGGHLGPALLRGGAPPAGAAGHPGVPRRPARHRDRAAGRAAQRRARWWAGRWRTCAR